MQLSSTYSRATLSAKVDTSSTNATWLGPGLTFAKAAYKPGMGASGYPSPTQTSINVCTESVGMSSSCVDVLGVGQGGTANITSIVAVPAAPTLVAGFDMSCQQSDLTLNLPSAAIVGGNSLVASNAVALALSLTASGGYGAVQIDWSSIDLALRPRIRSSQFSTSAGPVLISGYLAGAKGLTVSTSEGAIFMSNVDAVCDAVDVGGASGGMRASATVGSVSVTGLTSIDCDVRLSSQQSTVSLIGSTVANTLRGGTVYLNNRLGTTVFNHNVAQVSGSWLGSVTLKSPQCL